MVNSTELPSNYLALPNWSTANREVFIDQRLQVILHLFTHKKNLSKKRLSELTSEREKLLNEKKQIEKLTLIIAKKENKKKVTEVFHSAMLLKRKRRRGY